MAQAAAGKKAETAESENDPKTADAPESYTHDWLLSAAGVIGHPAHEIAGALAVEGTPETLTIEETQAAVAAWLAAPVNVEA